MLRNVEGRDTKHIAGLKELRHLGLSNISLKNLEDLTELNELIDLDIHYENILHYEV